MRKLLPIFLLLILGHSAIYASFPIVESNQFIQIESVDEEDKKLTKKQKLAWILVGLLGGLTGVIIALLAWIISKNKKGQLKFVFLGFGVYLIIVGLITFFIFGDIPFGLDEIGDIFILG